MSSEEEEKGKRKASDETDDTVTKKPRLEEGGASEQGPSVAVVKGGGSESDEEYVEESGGSDQEGYSSVEEGDSSEAEEEGGESGEGEDDTAIICGLGVKMKVIKDGKYRLFHQQEGRELKMIISEEHRASAMQATLDKQSNNLIPLLEAKGVDVTKDDEHELIVYAMSLTMASEEHPYLVREKEEEEGGEEEEDGEVMLQDNNFAVIKVDNIDELFATGDLLESH